MALCARMTSHKSVQLPWFKRCCPAARCGSLLGIAQIMSQAMSLLTMRRRNSESREVDTQPGANQREGRARGPPPRQSDGRRDGERLELGVANRWLNALSEDD